MEESIAIIKIAKIAGIAKVAKIENQMARPNSRLGMTETGLNRAG